MNQDLPSFVVLLSRGRTDQPLYDRLWGSGFLPSRYQGVKLRGGKEPVLYLANPAGCSQPTRRQMLDDIGVARRSPSRGDRRSRDPHPHRAVRAGLPDAAIGAGSHRPLATSRSRWSTCMDPTSRSPAATPRTACSPAGWPSAGCDSSSFTTWAGTSTATCPTRSCAQCHDTDQPSAALVKDLKQRGLLDDTLVIWGGEFGRTIYSQGQLTATNYGRDHHPRCFTIWMAGGGIKPGLVLRRDRRLLLQHRQGPGPCPRPERHDPPPPGHRAHQADLSLPGPRFPADRRARQGRQRDPGLRVWHVIRASPRPGPAHAGSGQPVRHRPRRRGR